MTDLQWLAAMILLTPLGAVPYIFQRALRIGLPRALGNPGIGDDTEMAPWAQRAKRAYMGLGATLVVLATLLG